MATPNQLVACLVAAISLSPHRPLARVPENTLKFSVESFSRRSVSIGRGRALGCHGRGAPLGRWLRCSAARGRRPRCLHERPRAMKLLRRIARAAIDLFAED